MKDLTDKVADLGGADWIPGLAEPGKIDGRQYGIPWYAANRVVIYNKDLFAKAGITTPPKTRDEWLDVTAKLNKGGNQGIYLPGQNWYALAGFIWDEGGDLAVKEGDQWKGALDTPQALAGDGVLQAAAGPRRGPQGLRRGQAAAGRRSSPRVTSPSSSRRPAGPWRSRRPTPR